MQTDIKKWMYLCMGGWLRGCVCPGRRSYIKGEKMIIRWNLIDMSFHCSPYNCNIHGKNKLLAWRKCLKKLNENAISLFNNIKKQNKTKNWKIAQFPWNVCFELRISFKNLNNIFSEQLHWFHSRTKRNHKPPFVSGENGRHEKKKFRTIV